MKEKWTKHYDGSKYEVWEASIKYTLKISNGKAVEVKIIVYKKNIKATQNNLDKLLEMGLNHVENNPKGVLKQVQKERVEMSKFEGKLKELKDMQIF